MAHVLHPQERSWVWCRKTEAAESRRHRQGKAVGEAREPFADGGAADGGAAGNTYATGRR
ncbi:hypothetical protein GCM10010222_66510 [Streptomyces tanashiensis]|nr:hypothetical protein GCM10010222_66510 [Streptomyces tanashiensis]